MASDSSGNQNIVTARPVNGLNVQRPECLVNESTYSAVKGLKEGDLVQLKFDVVEDEITLANSYSRVDPDSIATYFESPSIFIFSFYHYPGTEAIVLIWTKLGGVISRKHINAQVGVKLDIIAIAEGEGIKVTHTLSVQSQDQISGDRLREEIFASAD